MEPSGIWCLIPRYRGARSAALPWQCHLAYCLFVSQGLLTYKRIIPSEEETERMIGTAHAFAGLAIASFVFFGL